MPTAVRLEHQHADQRRLTVVDWNLGNICNYSCSYCPSFLHDGSVKWPPAEVILRFAACLHAHYSGLGQSLFFQFSGGEPTLHPSFRSIVEHLSSMGDVGVISNGSRPSSWWSEVADSLDYACISVHAERANLSHISDILSVITRKMSVHVNVTMIPERFDECYEIASQIGRGFSQVTITLKPLLKGFGKELFDYSDAQLDRLRQGLRCGSKRSASRPHRGPMRRVFSDGTSQIVSASQLLIRDDNHWKGWTCSAGVEMLSITRNGKVYIANCRQESLGSIYDDKLRFSDEPVICSQQSCSCLADIMLTKVNVEK